MSNNVDKAVTSSAGQKGFDYITGTVTGKKYAYLVCDVDSTFEATAIQGDNLPSKGRSEGIVIAGGYSGVVVTSGAVRGYHG